VLEALVADEKTKIKKENPVVTYFKSTRTELRKVRWPTLQQGWAMTKIVLLVTVVMALFLGVLDFFFGWLLSNLVTRNVLYIILSVVVVAVLLGASYLIGRGEEA
jgi:preprotein translocase SecE subunit